MNLMKKAIPWVLIIVLLLILPVNAITRTNTTSGGYVTSVFSGPGFMTFHTPVNSTGTKVYTDMFFVGGGGSGGSIVKIGAFWKSGAGGGGGGVTFNHELPLDENTTYMVYVGEGGVASTGAGDSGDSSYISAYPGNEFAGLGGGQGGWMGTAAYGSSGGSGGGGGWGGAGGSGYLTEGFAGGAGDASGYGTGGGGGFNNAGAAGARYNSGDGGQCQYPNATIISHFPMADSCYSGGGGGGGLPAWSTVQGYGGTLGGDGSYGSPAENGHNATGVGGGGGGAGYTTSYMLGGKGGDGIAMLRYFDESAPPDSPICSFTGTPRSGSSPLTVLFNDTSTGSPTSWNWHLYRPGTGLYISTEKNWTTEPLEAGEWTVDFNATNSGGSCSLHSPGYLSVSGEGWVDHIVVNLDVKDAQTGALIQDSGVGIKNTTSGVWRNSTSPTGLVYFDSTGLSYEFPLAIDQSITLAAGATGYVSDSVTFNIPYSNYRAYLYLLKTSVTPAAGTGTVIVNVISNKNGVSISGASVVLDTGQIGSTNTAGAVTFLNVTAGNRTATVSTPTYGYQTTSKAFDLFSGETKMLTFQLVLIGETPVPTFQPTTATTTDPGDLNASGTTFLAGWARMAIAFGGIIFFLAFLYFVKKVTK